MPRSLWSRHFREPKRTGIICYGTTTKRANELAGGSPPRLDYDPKYPADDFSFNDPWKSNKALGTSEEYVRRKANLFEDEGGASMLWAWVPEDIIDTAAPFDDGAFSFRPGYDLEGLQEIWPSLDMNVYLVEIK